jgi:hypothetical protein
VNVGALEMRQIEHVHQIVRTLRCGQEKRLGRRSFFVRPPKEKCKQNMQAIGTNKMLAC